MFAEISWTLIWGLVIRFWVYLLRSVLSTIFRSIIKGNSNSTNILIFFLISLLILYWYGFDTLTFPCKCSLMLYFHTSLLLFSRSLHSLGIIASFHLCVYCTFFEVYRFANWWLFGLPNNINGIINAVKKYSNNVIMSKLKIKLDRTSSKKTIFYNTDLLKQICPVKAWVHLPLRRY